MSIYLTGRRKFDRGHPPAQSNTTSNGDIFSIFYQHKSNVQKMKPTFVMFVWSVNWQQHKHWAKACVRPTPVWDIWPDSLNESVRTYQYWNCAFVEFFNRAFPVPNRLYRFLSKLIVRGWDIFDRAKISTLWLHGNRPCNILLVLPPSQPLSIWTSNSHFPNQSS